VSRILYLDCFSGISGDMTLGAFLDAGMPLDELKGALGSLALSDVEVSASRVLRTGVSATQFLVQEPGQQAGDAAPPRGAAEAQNHDHPDGHGHAREHDHDHAHGHGHGHARDHEHPHDHGHAHGHGHPHRSVREILEIIDRSALSASARDRARGMFRRLAEAEAAIHQMPVEKVHLHEVGAIDSIVDIVGAAFAFEWAKADRVVCSPLNVGGGMVKSAHGVFPVPAPATVKLLGNAPIYSGEVQKELVTPTGALIATTYADSFGPIPAMAVQSVGYGAGSRDNPATPNVLRLMIGRDAAVSKPKAGAAVGHGGAARPDQPATRVVVIECEIDDMNPQIFGAAMDRLYAAGALDVFYVPAQMKKNRPGTLLTVVAPPELRPTLADVLFRETTTIGVRYQEVERECLRREIVPVETPLGTVRFKVASRGGAIINALPEFDDCAALAATHNRSVKEVQSIAIRAFQP
jgi:uncharacterized protein (TIGR00299 family) protein